MGKSWENHRVFIHESFVVYIEFPSRTAFDFPVLRFASVCPALNFYVNLVIIVIVIIRIKAKACTSRGLLAKLY